jgi:hypothetical protein
MCGTSRRYWPAKSSETRRGRKGIPGREGSVPSAPVFPSKREGSANPSGLFVALFDRYSAGVPRRRGLPLCGCSSAQGLHGGKCSRAHLDSGYRTNRLPVHFFRDCRANKQCLADSEGEERRAPPCRQERAAERPSAAWAATEQRATSALAHLGGRRRRYGRFWQSKRKSACPHPVGAADPHVRGSPAENLRRG